MSGGIIALLAVIAIIFAYANGGFSVAGVSIILTIAIVGVAFFLLGRGGGS